MMDQRPKADPGHIAAMVERADRGDDGVRDALFASLYGELHRLAERHLRRGGSELTLGTTTLLHEVYLNLSRNAVFPDRLRFLKYASRAMRGLIIDYVRSRRAQKRGGEITFVTISEEEAGPTNGASLERLSDALDELALIDAALAELVDLKFFCGFSFTEIAAMRGLSERTVRRDWSKARVLLHDALQSVSDAGDRPAPH
jgi:RNA polymerase sigma factor (TIGR02999 family)